MNIQEMLISARARSEIPNITELKKKGFFPVDMHVHTRFSDSFTRVKKIIKRCELLGIGVGITDHNEIEGAVRASEIKTDILLIPGIEISTKEGPHVLVYFHSIEDLTDFYNRHIKNIRSNISFDRIGLSIYELSRITKTYDCLTSFAHPCGPGYFHYEKSVSGGTLIKDIIHEIPAIEVINGVNTRKMNLLATDLAKKYDKAITGGSDAHSLSQVGNVLTCAKTNNPRLFLEAIKENRNIVIGTELSRIKYLPYLAKCLPKHIAHPINKVTNYHSSFLRPKIKKHSPKVMEKVDDIKGKSVRAIKDPVRAVRRLRVETKILTKRIIKYR
jgi:predicted metal-dependent phosphoesterase TrpH